MAAMVRPPLVNEHAARLVAGATAAALALAWALELRWVVPLVAAGFVVRATVGPRYSLLARAGGAVASRLWRPRLVPAAPKRFAQGIGAAFTVLASVLLWGSPATASAAWALGGIIVACALLEAGLGFCLGCQVYGRLQRLGWISPEACPACGEGEGAPAHGR